MEDMESKLVIYFLILSRFPFSFFILSQISGTMMTFFSMLGMSYIPEVYFQLYDFFMYSESSVPGVLYYRKVKPNVYLRVIQKKCEGS